MISEEYVAGVSETCVEPKDKACSSLVCMLDGFLVGKTINDLIEHYNVVVVFKVENHEISMQFNNSFVTVFGSKKYNHKNNNDYLKEYKGSKITRIVHKHAIAFIASKNEFISQIRFYLEGEEMLYVEYSYKGGSLEIVCRDNGNILHTETDRYEWINT